MLFSSTVLPLPLTLRTPHTSMQGISNNNNSGSSGGLGAVQLNPLTAPGESSPPLNFIDKSNSSSKGEVPRLKPPSPATSAPSTRPHQLSPLLHTPLSVSLPMSMSHTHDGNSNISGSGSRERERDRDVSDINIMPSLSADSFSNSSSSSSKRTI